MNCNRWHYFAERVKCKYRMKTYLKDDMYEKIPRMNALIEKHSDYDKY